MGKVEFKYFSSPENLLNSFHPTLDITVLCPHCIVVIGRVHFIMVVFLGMCLFLEKRKETNGVEKVWKTSSVSLHKKNCMNLL